MDRRAEAALMMWIAIAAGGALGAVTRHLVTQLASQRLTGSTFPAGIFVVNVAGSFAIGVLAGLLAAGRVQLSDPARAFLTIGFLGGFTTFSAFSLDTLALVRGGYVAYALANVAGQVSVSLLAVWAGWALARPG